MNIPIFDGHNDTLTRIFKDRQTDPERSFFTSSKTGCIELPKALEGGFAGGFFAIFTPNPESDGWKPVDPADGAPNGYSIPLPPQISQSYAYEFVRKMMGQLKVWEMQSEGQLKIIRTADELPACIAAGQLAAILHIEGAEALKKDLSNLGELYDGGLRSIGPVWSRPNDFAHGVPFAHPQSPDTGPGLTEAGKDLVRICNQAGILLDMSHLNEKGFFDTAKLTDAPIVATHSGVWNICRNTRNLTDKQLDAIAESNGITGLNFCKNFLRKDGMLNQPTSLTEIVDHIRYIVDRNGIDHVALGSDFDGAKMPDDLPDASALPALVNALRKAGFHHSELEKICWKNWHRILQDTWK